MICLKFFHLMIVFMSVKCDIEPYIGGGALATYDQYPHSVYLAIVCTEKISCGGSILNQNLVLTAAHCLYNCDNVTNQMIVVKYGHEIIQQMNSTSVINFILHEDYDEEQSINDISLLITDRAMSFENQAKRVILMRNPTLPTVAHVSGWGLDENEQPTDLLKHTKAFIQSAQICKVIMHPEHAGRFCAGPITGTGVVLRGNSGDALMIDGFIQIGIVSYKYKTYGLAAYTNVSYYLSWIQKNAKELLCPVTDNFE